MSASACFVPRPHNCALTSEDTEDSGARTGQTNLASDSQMEDGHQCECELEATQCGIEVRENRADDEWRIGGRMICRMNECAEDNYEQV